MKTPDRRRSGSLPSAQNGLRGLYLGVWCYRRPTIGASPTTFHTVSEGRFYELRAMTEFSEVHGIKVPAGPSIWDPARRSHSPPGSGGGVGRNPRGRSGFSLACVPALCDDFLMYNAGRIVMCPRRPPRPPTIPQDPRKRIRPQRRVRGGGGCSAASLRGPLN